MSDIGDFLEYTCVTKQRLIKGNRYLWRNNTDGSTGGSTPANINLLYLVNEATKINVAEGKNDNSLTCIFKPKKGTEG